MDNLTDILEYISPSELSYQEWVDVGMAIKHEGLPCSVWDDWSQSDRRYHPGECEKKWNSFQGSGTPITAGTIVHMAKARGWVPTRDEGHALDWDSVISVDWDDLKIIDKGWVEPKELHEPELEQWDPVKDIITYLETLFEANENVGYVTESFSKDGKYIPKNKGAYDRTAGELIRELTKYRDIGSVFGDYDPAGGAWIRFNPMDGAGAKNENVTDFRYALVESDSLDIEKQNAIIRELELPVAALVYSGGKSIHAIVRVDAADYQEYRRNVEYLYEVCRRNGLEVDTQNKNPSRLSRMPGVMRNGKKQYLIDTNIGKESWKDWKEWIESVNDDLPDFQKLSDVWDDMPELSPPLIDGILRQGHKMLLSGPSKAGKSFALIQLVIAIAEGKRWMGRRCAQGKVLYVNLELDRASCFHRFREVYEAMDIPSDGIDNIDIWNLRGKSIPMNELAPKLIRRAQKQDYIAIIIDPIYKVLTGDENSAEKMAEFCNQFDKICTDLGCAVIYCHHHSKGGQASKMAADRASGSGVFARDPDALMDMIELDISENDVGIPDRCTGWRIETVIREFAPPEPFETVFDYPVHHVTSGLSDAREKKGGRLKTLNDKRKDEKEKNVEKLVEFVRNYPEFTGTGFPPKIAEAARHFEVAEKTIKRWADTTDELQCNQGIIFARKEVDTQDKR